MRIADSIARAGRGLKNAKGRTILTSLAIAVGAFTLTLALAVGEGARQYADKLIKNNIDPQALFVVKDSALTESGGQVGLREYDPDVSALYRPGTTVKMINEADVTALRNNSSLTTVTPIYALSPQFMTFSLSDKKYIGGVDYYDTSMLHELAAGQLPALGQQIGNTDIVVPEAFVKTLGKQPSEMIGSTVTITFAQQQANVSQEELQRSFLSGGTEAVESLVKPKTREFPFTVRAVSKAQAMSFQSVPQVLVSDEAAKTISSFQQEGTDTAGKYTGVTAIVKAGTDPETVKKDLEQQGFSVQTAKDAQNLLFSVVNVIQGIVAGFGVLALIASVFGIINTQYISVLERTREIGLMKALGMRGRHVSRLFQYEAAWIGFLGGLIGVGLAYAVGTLLNPWVTKTLALGDGVSLLIFQPLPIMLLIAGLMVVAMAAGWLPSHKAATLDPIEALRTE